MASMPPWWSGWLSRASSWSPSTTASAPAKPWSALTLGGVIVTDHHTIPPQRPPLLALLHPALTPPSSPYRGLAGVGLAYVLAAAVAERLRNPQALRTALVVLYWHHRDMAPPRRQSPLAAGGLPQLHRSALPGLRALAELSGLEIAPSIAKGWLSPGPSPQCRRSLGRSPARC